MSYAKLIDTTKCIGCHACQVACKEWNALEGEKTQLQTSSIFGSFQNPTTLSQNNYMLITHHEIDDPKAPGGFRDIFTKRQCMHCDDPACVSACPVTALKKSEEGPVVYHPDICIGCRYCMLACPFGAISAEWNSLAPKITKCTLCVDRLHPVAPLERNGQKLSLEDAKRLEHAEARLSHGGDAGSLAADARETFVRLGATPWIARADAVSAQALAPEPTA